MTTCGTAILNKNKILLCHSTGNKHWDIPKGIKELGETYKQTAIRECIEETGVVLNEKELTDLGKYKYTSKKNLYLFKTYKDLNTSKMICTSYFERYNKKFPEVDDFGYFTKSEALERASKVLGKVLETLDF